MHKEKDRAVANGEVGLDYPGAKTAVLRENQELILIEFLTAVRSKEDFKDLPLVLHVKDMSFDKQDASARCLSILKEVGYPVSHRIYRHSFLGTRREADAWIEAFPMWCLGRLQKRLVHRRGHRIFSARLALIGSWWKLMLLTRALCGWGDGAPCHYSLPRGGSAQVAGRSAWCRQSHTDLKDCKRQFHGFLWNWRFPSFRPVACAVGVLLQFWWL